MSPIGLPQAAARSLPLPRGASALLEHRRQFPALANKLYANFGVAGPMARSTLEALTRHYQQQQELGPSGPAVFTAQAQADDDLRRDLGALLEVEPKRLALTDSTCTGCSAVLLAIPWRAGDQLLLSDAEYPALLQLARLLARRSGVEVITVPLLGRAHEAEALVAAALTPRTRALLFSQVLWTSGEQVDVGALAALVAGRTPRPLLLIDGAQGPGNVLARPAADGVDAYAFPGHKSLCGPDGIGALYLAGRLLEGDEALEPMTAGWRGVRVDASGAAAGWAAGARRFEASTTTFGTRPALREALRVADEFAPIAARCARVAGLVERAFHAVRAAGFATFLEAPPGTSLLAFRVPGVPVNTVAAALLRERMVVRALPQTDVVRLSLGYLTTEDEVDALVAALARRARSGDWTS